MCEHFFTSQSITVPAQTSIKHDYTMPDTPTFSQIPINVATTSPNTHKTSLDPPKHQKNTATPFHKPHTSFSPQKNCPHLVTATPLHKAHTSPNQKKSSLLGQLLPVARFLPAPFLQVLQSLLLCHGPLDSGALGLASVTLQMAVNLLIELVSVLGKALVPCLQDVLALLVCVG